MNCKVCNKKCLKSDTCATCRKKASYIPKKITCTVCGCSCQKKDDQLCSRCRYIKFESEAYQNDPCYREYKKQKSLESYHRTHQKKQQELNNNNNLIEQI